MMSDTPNDFRIQPYDMPEFYELRVNGRLQRESAFWFEDMTLTIDESTSPVQTIIKGSIRDQATLYGLISRIRDLGLILISVKQLEQKEDS
jgi:hypothetical protein